MSFFRNLFGGPGAAAKAAAERRPEAVPTPVQAAQPRALAYDPALVPSLKDDHQQLLASCRRMEASCEAGSLEACRKELQQFKRQLTDQEMNEIAKVVTTFLETYGGDDGAISTRSSPRTWTPSALRWRSGSRARKRRCIRCTRRRGQPGARKGLPNLVA